jgi:hypothetical protein
VWWWVRWVAGVGWDGRGVCAGAVLVGRGGTLAPHVRRGLAGWEEGAGPSEPPPALQPTLGQQDVPGGARREERPALVACVGGGESLQLERRKGEPSTVGKVATWCWVAGRCTLQGLRLPPARPGGRAAGHGHRAAGPGAGAGSFGGCMRQAAGPSAPGEGSCSRALCAASLLLCRRSSTSVRLAAARTAVLHCAAPRCCSHPPQMRAFHALVARGSTCSPLPLRPGPMTTHLRARRASGLGSGAAPAGGALAGRAGGAGCRVQGAGCRVQGAARRAAGGCAGAALVGRAPLLAHVLEQVLCGGRKAGVWFKWQGQPVR